MEAVIEKLAEIEKTAEAIVEEAQAQKSEIEKEIQAKRDAFDQQLEEDTRKKLSEIRAEGEQKINALLEEEGRALGVIQPNGEGDKQEHGEKHDEDAGTEDDVKESLERPVDGPVVKAF